MDARATHGWRAWLSPRAAGGYAALFVFLLVAGAWLAADLARERERILADTAGLAVHKSQLMSRSFGSTFLAADYVLRDVIGRAGLGSPDNAGRRFQPAPAAIWRLESLLREKVATVPGLTDLVLLDGDCLFVAVGMAPLRGTKSRQRFCAGERVAPGQEVHVQYMPAEKSASHRPVVLMSRTLGSPSGELLGAAMAVIDLDYAQQWIAGFGAARHDVLAIVDTEGTLLARNPPLPGALGRRIATLGGLAAHGEHGDMARVAAESPLDGRARINGLSRVERFPFVALVGIDQEHALASWRHRAWQFAIGFGVLCALAATDPLTGIANRRQLMLIGHREFARARRHGGALSVLMLDIDHFKDINDRWGHPTGDRVIQALARATLSIVRQHDTSGRLGGEEFAIVLPETDATGARVIAERLRRVIEESREATSDDGSAVAYTVSIGVASLGADEIAFDDLLRQADQALYRAKRDGRNRVTAARRIVPAAPAPAPR